MRRTGKTTQAVDLAVQELFTNGEIIVPAHNLYKDGDLGKYLRGWFCTWHIAVDPDFGKGYAQRDFVDRLLRRLKYEHNLIVDNRSRKGSFYHIKIK